MPTKWSKAVARFRNAQRGNAGGATGNALRKGPREDLGAVASKDGGRAVSKTGAWRAGNDCDAFCSARELAKECHGSRQ